MALNMQTLLSNQSSYLQAHFENFKISANDQENHSGTRRPMKCRLCIICYYLLPEGLVCGGGGVLNLSLPVPHPISQLTLLLIPQRRLNEYICFLVTPCGKKSSNGLALVKICRVQELFDVQFV
jgi:hypothetical protein